MAVPPSPLEELAGVAGAAQTIRLETKFDLAGGKTLRVDVDGYQSGGPWYGRLRLWETEGDRLHSRDDFDVKRLDDAIRKVAKEYPKAVLRPSSVTVRIRKGPTTGAKVQPIAVRAWHQAYGSPIPSPREIAEQRKQDRAALRAAANGTVALLKTGPSGVKEFNRRPAVERAETDLRKADLSGSNLSGIRFFSGARLSGARLVGARLTKADLSRCKCGGADFSGADLTGADAGVSTFLRANFTGTNLTNAHFGYSDLRGANFTGATLTGCSFIRAKFDENTRWPKGYKPPAMLVWKGNGPDPRLAPTRRQKARPGPTDFPGFLDRLKKVADKSKLEKAMAMLRAERFSLFARVHPDHLVGVVKSQSSPDLVYSCRLASDGTYSCCTQNLNVCGGLRGSPCKHLLVLIVGLAKAGELDPGTAHEWTQASRGRKAELDKDAMTETLLRYKGAEAGEVDWRPTETIPEDFYTI